VKAHIESRLKYYFLA